MPGVLEGQALEGPRRWPLIGNLPQLAGDLAAICMHRLVRKYGDLFRLELPPVTYAVVSHPDALKTVLVDEHDKTKRPHVVMRGEDLWGTDSFYLNDGPRWLDRRRLFNRSFRSDEIDRLVKIFHERTDIVVQQLDEIAGRDRSLDLRAALIRLAIDATGLYLYEYDYDTQHGDGEYDECLREYWAHVTWRTLIPFEYYKIFPTPEYRRKQRALESLEALVRRAVEARRERNDHAEKFDPVSLMLRANQEAKPEFSEKEIRDQLMLFMQAGVEPTAPLLYWSIHELCEHPEHQDRIAEEAIRVSPDDEHPGHQQLKELSHCEAVVRETTRLRPPVLAIYRGLSEDMMLSGWRIPKEWDIWMPIYSIQRDPRFWEAPDDFHPERWLDRSSMHRFQYLAFGAGSRVCPGEYASILPTVLLVSRLCRRYRFRMAPGARMKIENGGFMQLRSSLPIMVTLRNAG